MNLPAFLCAALLTTSLLTGCDNTAETRTTTTKKPVPAVPAAAEATYECPMGCEGSTSAKPGKCPVCGMELEKKS